MIFLNLDGIITTTYKRKWQKISKFLHTEYIDKNGNLTSQAKERGKRQNKILTTKGKFYILKNIFNVDFKQILPAKEIRRISPALETKTRENF
ncbi:MAG: hypothetical protein QXN55_00545 [Candidatus Nitrosotenuis sp.]